MKSKLKDFLEPQMITSFTDYTKKEIPRKLVVLESYWSNDMSDEISVKNILEAFCPILNPPIKLYHRYVESKKGFKYYTKEILPNDRDTHDSPVYYVAIHGNPGQLEFEKENMEYDALIDAFKGYDKTDTIVYFGSCSLFRGTEGQKFGYRFLKATGVRGVFGYIDAVSYLEDTIISYLFFNYFFSTQNPFDSLHLIYEQLINEYLPALDCGFQMFLRDEIS